MSFKFSGHQTFVFRYGWLEKGVDLVRNNPKGFNADDAIVTLGVGKNMVESIKYWCLQTGLIMESSVPGAMCLTSLGEYIFGNFDAEGVDPYLEDDASLWLLHYNVVARAPESATSIAINSLNKPEFSKAELFDFLRRYLDGKVKVSDKTLGRDVDCFIHAYVGTKSRNSEESLDCPFLSLSLIQPTIDSDLYRINIGNKQNLPIELIGYALLNLMTEGSSSINLYNATYAKHSPGQIFKLSDNAIVDAVLGLEQLTNGDFTFTDTAGINTINYTSNVKKQVYAQKLLDKYYGVSK